VLLCFLVASTFWLLNSLNKTYQEVRISYPVTFVYNPKKFVPVTAPPQQVTIVVNGKGWKLLRKQLSLRIRPARIEIPLQFRQNYLTNRQLRPLLVAALNGLELSYVVTDTLYFNFQPLVRRKLRLVPDSTQTLTSPQFAVAGKVRLEPEEITVSGPASLVNSLPNPYPIHFPDSNLTKDYTGEAPLSFASQSLIKASVKAIRTAIKVIPLHEGKAQVAVRLRSEMVAGKQPVATQPVAIQLKYYFLPESPLINPSEIVVEADLSRFNAADSTAPLQLSHKPAAVKTVSFTPKKVKILF
jgi:hypothetical protein